MPRTPKTARHRTKYRPPPKVSKASHRTVVFDIPTLEKLRPYAQKMDVSVNELVRQLVNKAIFEGWLK